VIVVVNHPVDAPLALKQDNRLTVQLLGGRESVRVLEREYPRDVAGVGAARRSGMDLALRRLVRAGTAHRAAIVCLDADSPVAPGYGEAIRRVFASAKPPLAGVCAHRHRLPDDRKGMRNIVAYELWLRYIELGFLTCRSPYAFQTIGSCTVASPMGYALADGMPRRQAGEDFYFLQKIVKAGGSGGVVQISDALVFPSARVSDRVPFGTGRAMTRCATRGPGSYLRAEPPEAFLNLKDFFESATGRYTHGGDFESCAVPRLRAFLAAHHGWPVLEGLRENAADADHFLRALHTWFDSLRVVRYAKACKARLGGVWLFDAIAELAGERIGDLPRPDPEDPDLDLQIRWLERLRGLPRG
jgi:hypothetical protein